MFGVMTETVRNAAIIDKAVARPDRRCVDDVRRAYRRIIELVEHETGASVDPKGHVQWLRDISRGGIRIMQKKDTLHTVLHEIEWSARYDDALGGGCPIETFDPSEHFVIVTEPSVLSYLAEPMVAPIDVFGGNAMAVSPSFKCSMLWWNV